MAKKRLIIRALQKSKTPSKRIDTKSRSPNNGHYPRKRASPLNALEILPFILFIVVIVTTISEKINVPYPLLLVLAGLIVGFIPGVPNWHPPTDIILPLFLPPILFAAARVVSSQDIKNNISTIGSLSIALVVATTLIVALVLHWFIPQMNYSTALVLSAIISPTDTTAATAILNRMNIRQHIIRTVEVESLFNDAMGIVLYKASVLFVFLGTIKIVDVGSQILLVGLGGIVVGFVFAYFTRLIIEQFLTKTENELPIIMSLILAYVAFMFADRVGVSGVLAVVTAGLYHRKTEQKVSANSRLSETSVWSTLIFFLNGILFISIGMQFQSFLKMVDYIPTSDLILFSILTILTLIILRIVWVSATSYLTYLLKRKRLGSKKYDTLFQETCIVSWSGMRGLVSLALAIALPEMISATSAFPYRSLIIFLTLMTILFTLLVQGLTLPPLIRRLKAGKDDTRELRRISNVHQKLMQAAINNMNKLEEQGSAYSKEAKSLVKNYYANRLLQFTGALETESESEAHVINEEALDLLEKVLQYERDELSKMLDHGKITQEIYFRVLRKIDRDEVGFASYR